MDGPVLLPDRPPIEQRTIRLGTREIAYLLKRSRRRRRMGLEVNEGGLMLSVPWRTSDRRIRQALSEAAAWIIEKLQIWDARKPPELAWRHGEALCYLGAPVLLEVVQRAGPPDIRLLGFSLLVSSAAEGGAALREAIVPWLKGEALSLFRRRVEHYVAVLEIAVPRIRLSDARSRWGSCNGRGELRFNWRLVQAPLRLVDYVVVHELAHIKILNHSPVFWALVESILPDYRVRRRELNEQGHRYLSV